MRKTVFVTIGIFLATVLVSVQPAFAQTSKAVKAAPRPEQNLDNLKKRADNLIDVRVNSLNKLMQRVQGDKGVSPEEKTALSTEIQTDMTGLINLKAKIDTDTDINTARADAKSIITNFRVFAIFEPKIRTLVIIDNLSTLSGKVFSVAQKLQDLTKTLKSQGKDVSNIQRSLDEISSDLSTINYKLAADRQTVLNTSVSSDPSVFTAVRKDLGTVRSEFALIRAAIAQTRSAFNASLKGQKITLPTVSPAKR